MYSEQTRKKARNESSAPYLRSMTHTCSQFCAANVFFRQSYSFCWRNRGGEPELSRAFDMFPLRDKLVASFSPQITSLAPILVILLKKTRKKPEMSRIFHILCQLNTHRASFTPKVTLLRPTLLLLSGKAGIPYLRSITHICSQLYPSNDSFVAITTHVLEQTKQKA